VPTVNSSGNVTDAGTRRPRQHTPKYENCTQRFGSAHSSGFHVVLCDGSVQTVRYSIDLVVFSYLGNRKDQRPFDSPF
jgi:hypothetical protein